MQFKCKFVKEVCNSYYHVSVTLHYLMGYDLNNVKMDIF